MRFALGLSAAAAATAFSLLVSAAPGAVVADYAASFPTASDPTVENGWAYLTNNAGPIGAAANYRTLVWTGVFGGSYKYDSSGDFPDQPGTYEDGAVASPDPSTYIYLVSTGGHPGQGVAQQSGAAATDRFAIPAFTLSQTAPTTIAGSFSSGTGNSQELRIYVNDSLKFSAVTSGTTPIDLGSADLGGVLNAGDTIYVAMGPNGTHNSDGFNIAFTIDQVPEPTGLGLLLAGGALLARRRRI